MKEIVILGAGDFGKEVAWLIEEINKRTPTYIILGYCNFACSAVKLNSFNIQAVDFRNIL